MTDATPPLPRQTLSPSAPALSWTRVLRLAWIPLVVWTLSILAAEAAFRLAGTRVIAAMGGFYESFADGTYKHRPSAAAYHDWASGTFWAYTDSSGFRVGDSDRQRAELSPDILVLGDSQAFGQGVEFEQSMIGVFASKANVAGLTVANAAVGGHSVRDQLEVSRWLASAQNCRPRVLLYCLSPRALAYPESISKAIVIDGGLWDAPPTWKDHLRRWLSSNSAVFVVGRDAARNVRNAIRPRKGPSAAADILTLYEQGAAQTIRARQLASSFEELMRTFGEPGPRLVFAYLPLAIEPKITEMAAAANFSASSGAALETTAKLAEILRVPVVDVSPALEQVRTNGGSVTLKGDNHYGPEASRLVGERLWDEVRAAIESSR